MKPKKVKAIELFQKLQEEAKRLDTGRGGYIRNSVEWREQLAHLLKRRINNEMRGHAGNPNFEVTISRVRIRTGGASKLRPAVCYQIGETLFAVVEPRRGMVYTDRSRLVIVWR